jgi:hypothetical protein
LKPVSPVQVADGFESIDTLRYLLLDRAGIITRPNGIATLDVGSSVAVPIASDSWKSGSKSPDFLSHQG